MSEVSSLAANQVEVLSEKLVELQEAISAHTMNTIRFDRLDNIEDVHERRSKMKRLLEYNKSHIDNGDYASDIGNNYFHMNSSASFWVGPEQVELLFHCDMGADEGDAQGNITFGEMWGYECEFDYGQ